MIDKPKEKVKHRPGQYLLSHQTDGEASLYERKTDHPTTGRPSGYKPEYDDDIVEFMSKGRSLTQWLVKIGTSSQSMKRWAASVPSFRKAKDRAIEANMAYWESIGERATVGQIPRFQQATYRFMMKNRFPHVYKDIHHTEQTTTVKFETFVNETGQIQQNNSTDLLEGEVIEEHDKDD